MITWRHAPLAESCGSCDKPIAAGELELFIQLHAGDRVRCKACGEAFTHEDAPESLPEAEHTPSLMELSGERSHGFVSTGELAKRRASNHFRQRGRR